jgi:glucose-6-phosphate isomerase
MKKKKISNNLMVYLKILPKKQAKSKFSRWKKNVRAESNGTETKRIQKKKQINKTDKPLDFPRKK